MNTMIHDLVLRAERPSDETVLRRLAALDSTRPLRGRSLVAELDGTPVAALDLTDGRVIADPFRHTADAVALLRLRAARQTVVTAAPRRSRFARLGRAAA